MKTLPVFLAVRGKPCLLVGEGEVAARKQRLLKKAGALVRLGGEQFAAQDLDGVMLVVAASANLVLNRAVSAAAQARGIPVNVVDQPALCTCIFPAIVERGDITVAVSSNGAVPVMTRLLRARLEAWLPASLGEFAALTASWRGRIKQALPDARQRLQFWDQLLQRQLIGAGGNLAQGLSDEDVQQALQQFSLSAVRGSISIVGAGPGDPDLLTFKALRCLQACEVLAFDEQVDARIVELARRDAQRIVLQAGAAPDMLQQQAENGARVVWLKAGDPLSHRDVPLWLAQWQAAGVECDCVAGVIDQQAMEFCVR